jgi:hypothetical protein
MDKQKPKLIGRRPRALALERPGSAPALAVALGLAAALALSLPAHSQDAPAPLSVTIDARAYAALDPASDIEVDAANDTDQAQRLKVDIVAALQARGFRIADGAPIVLQFYATEPYATSSPQAGYVSPSTIAGRPGPVGPNAGDTSATTPANGARFQTSVVSNITDSLFPSKSDSTGAPPPPPGRAIHVNIDVNDRRVARRVWQGSAGTFTDRPDSYAVSSALVPALIERLGANAQSEQVDVP